MARKYTFFLILVLFSYAVRSQNIDGIFSPDITDIYPGANVETVDTRSTDVIIDKPITPEWTQADITINNRVVRYLMKFDHYSNKIYLRKGDDMVQIPSRYVAGFKLISYLGEERVFKKTTSPFFNDVFVEVLVEDKVVLYKQHDAKLLRSNYNAILDAGNFNDKIVTKELYFLQNGSNDIVQIPASKKQAKALLKKQYFPVVKFIDKEKLKVNKEEDLIAIVNYLNKNKK